MVLFGGRSGEHPISCATAGGVLRAIDRDRYDVVAVGVTPAGRWVLVDDEPDEMVVALAGHEAAGVETPETFLVTADDVQAAADEAAATLGLDPALTDDTDTSDTPSDTTNEPDTGQED